jgi:hypothetical protein
MLESLKDCPQAISCSIYSGKADIGFDAHEIGTKSIQSRAAWLLLFLMNHSTSNRIMMLLGS